jgi:hypothetical protein
MDAKIFSSEMRFSYVRQGQSQRLVRVFDTIQTKEQTMEENLHTEQIQEIDEEQAEYANGGGIALETLYINKKLLFGREHAEPMAKELQQRIRKNAKAGEVFDVDNGWTKPLTKQSLRTRISAKI